IYLNQLFKEIFFAFKPLDINEALNIWVRQLSGYRQIGLTKQQLAVKFEKSVEDIHLLTTSVTHTLLNQIYKHANAFILRTIRYTQENSAARLTRAVQTTADFL